ncbi:MAG: hypothetical protein VYB51_06955, partial [Gemmatimonadota bacterium]|nr:hypothetical protein [Gemmatimonadota bacterium]
YAEDPSPVEDGDAGLFQKAEDFFARQKDEIFEYINRMSGRKGPIEEMMDPKPEPKKPKKPTKRRGPMKKPQYGYQPWLVQMGGQTGGGEGEEFYVYQYQGTTMDPTYQFANKKLQENDILSVVRPWHTKMFPDEALGSHHRQYNWLRKLKFRGMKRRIYSDFDRIEKTTNYAGTLVSRPIKMGAFTQEDMELKFSLWQLDDKELLKKIWQELSPFVDSGGKIKDTVGLKVDDNVNTYSSKELQFMHTFEHGGKLQILRAADRVFYDAALKYIKERNFDQMEEEIADVMRQDKEEHGEPGFMQEVVDKVEDTARDQINFWAKNAKDLASVGINAALSAAMGYVMRKMTDPVNLTDRPMMEEVWANLDGESRTLLGRIRTLNRRARQLGEGGYFPINFQGQNLMDQL